MNHSVSTLTGKTKIKIVFLGNQAVGKSSVIEQYIHNRFQQTSHPTVGIDFLAKNVIHKNKNFRLQLWDTAGQQRFRSLIPSYLKDSQCALIMFDVTNKESFNIIQEWIKMYNQNKTGGITLMVGNKIDLIRDRQVTLEQAIKKAQSLGICYSQISAKTGQNLQNLFLKVIQICTNPSFDLSKFNFKNHSEPVQIDEVQQKNQQDKQKQIQKPNFSKKQKLTIKQIEPKIQQKITPDKKQYNKTISDSMVVQKSDLKDSKVIRLQQKIQKSKKAKKCC